MKVYEISLDDSSSVVEKDVRNIIYYLEESEPGDEWLIRVAEMSEKEYNDLPEFDGF